MQLVPPGGLSTWLPEPESELSCSCVLLEPFLKASLAHTCALTHTQFGKDEGSVGEVEVIL